MFLVPAIIGAVLVIVAIVLERRQALRRRDAESTGAHELPDRLDSALWKAALFCELIALLIAIAQGFKA